MHCTFQLVYTCMCLIGPIFAAANFDQVKVKSRMEYVVIRREMNPLLIASTHNATTLEFCAAVCSMQKHTVSMYYVRDDQTCYCNNRTDVSTEHEATMPEVIYGQFDQLDEILENKDTGQLHTNSLLFKEDCLDLHSAEPSTDGVYTIQPAGQAPVDTWCDMQNGGWTVFQRRLDGSEDFQRGWSDYVSGFGNKTGEYWLGLDNLHALTLQASELHIYAEAFEGKSPESAFAHYSTVTVEGPSLNYSLHVEGHTGGCQDPITVNPSMNDMQFSTFDRDNDVHDDSNCAELYRGGWWYAFCHHANFNGFYYGGYHTTAADGIDWRSCWGYKYSVKETILKVRRGSPT